MWWCLDDHAVVDEDGQPEEVELGGSHAMARVGDVFYHCSGYSVKVAARHSMRTIYHLPLKGMHLLKTRDGKEGRVFCGYTVGFDNIF